MLITQIVNAQHNKDSLSYYYYKINNPQKDTDLRDGIQFYLELKEKDLSSGDSLNAIYDLRMVSIGQFETDDLYESESSAVEALSLIDKLYFKDTLIDSRIGLYNQLGRIYKEMFKYDSAIEVYDKALLISKKRKDSITLLNNKANIFKELKEYKKAINLYSLVYKKSKEQNNSQQLSMALDNLGYVQSKINDSNALNNLRESLGFRLNNNDNTGLYSSYRSLAYYYYDRGKHKEALFYTNKAYEVSKIINSASYTKDALSLLILVTNNQTAKKYIKLTDSISKAKQLKENKNAFLKYNLDTERKKTETNKLLKEKEKRLKLIYLGLGIFVSIAALFIIINIRLRYKEQIIKQIYKTETRISKRMHDEVANDVYHVMTQLQSSNNTNEDILDELDAIYIKTRDISKENSAIDLTGNFSELLNDLLLSYKNEEVTIITRNTSEINWDSVSEIKKNIIYRVLQELMTNMHKHSKATHVVLTFGKTKNMISIIYNDNGIGCVLIKSSGLINMENRISSIKGSLIFESEINKGFRVKITV